MANSYVPVTPGDGAKKIATYSITEDSIAKEIQRQVPSKMDGTDINPLSVANGIGDGNKAVATAGTAVKIAQNATPCTCVIITAKSTNTGVIAVGGSGVVANTSGQRGIPLAAGDTISLDINDVSKVYIDATVNGEGISYLYLS